jgi:YebC/PmpR family DNA-binding regulatory protein
MAGHSQFKNIMYRKGAQDAKRAKLFTKVIRELTLAARSGVPDPAMNPRLRAAIQAARAVNLPKDRIERAISRGGGGDDESYEEIRYEGYASGGVALIVEALTDNRNRTAAEVRGAFTRCEGALAETGSVTHLFERVGEVSYPPDAASADEMLEAAIEAGADDCDSGSHGHEVTCAPDRFNDVREALEDRFGPAESAKLAWKPRATVPVEEQQARSLFKLIETLEDSDDVQTVSANYDVPDDVMEALSVGEERNAAS